MSTFLGHIEVGLDAKGRVAIPACFRKVLVENNPNGRVFFRKDIYEDCLIFYPENVWNETVQDLRQGLNEWDPEDRMLLAQFSDEARELEMDTQNRVLLNKNTLSSIHSAVSQKVCFVGMFDKFALWDVDTYEKKRMDKQTFANKLKEKMTNKHAE
ncbi:MAG: hypothetical protein II502_01395 [Paludibacteraceae bacterium]|nr:hypothetical protein [Paludibacteraceae bacterium]